jgi:putative ABC transport system permease protein
VIGIAISGQTFYLFILDNLRHLAAIKAMGASDGQLTRMVLVQAASAGGLGYGLGIGLTALFFVLFIGTDLDFQVHWEVLALTGGAIVLIVIIASLAALGKVLRLEPGVVFKG